MSWTGKTLGTWAEPFSSARLLGTPADEAAPPVPLTEVASAIAAWEKENRAKKKKLSFGMGLNGATVEQGSKLYKARNGRWLVLHTTIIVLRVFWHTDSPTDAQKKDAINELKRLACSIRRRLNWRAAVVDFNPELVGVEHGAYWEARVPKRRK